MGNFTFWVHTKHFKSTLLKFQARDAKQSASLAQNSSWTAVTYFDKPGLVLKSHVFTNTPPRDYVLSNQIV